MKRVFLDIDGVLADFIGPAMASHGVAFDPSTYPPCCWDTWKVIGCTEEDFWRFDCFEFWRDLPKYRWANDLVCGLEERFGRRNICLLTNPSDHRDCKAGKDAWIERHFPAYKRQVLFGKPKHLCAHSRAILIDDSDANCDAFYRAGGWAIPFPRVWNHCGEKAHPAADVLKYIDDYMVRVQD